MRSVLSSLIVLALASAGRLSAGVINDSPIQGTYTIGSFAPIGQTFIAVDAMIGVAGFEISISNPSQPTPPPITFNLFSGAGMGGPLIGTRTIAGPPDAFPMTPRFVTANFTGVVLTPGGTYTLSALDPTDYWGVSHTMDVYSGGSGVLCGSATTNCNFSPFEPSQIDLKFEVLAAPEPMTFGYMTAGIALLAMLRKRR